MGRRMFSDKVVETDKFLDMPVSTQNLYFHLCMHADDDGFLGNPKTITRSIGGQQDDLTHLIEKGYVLVFEDGTVAITDWFVHNYIPKDRYHKTVYQENKKQLELSETKQYRLVTRSPIVQDTESKQDVYNMDTDCIQDANKVYTEDKLSKDKLSKDKLIIDKLDENKTASADFVKNDFVKRLINGNYIQQNDLELEKYKELYELLKTHYSDKRIAIVLSYTIEWAKNRTIKNKYGYLEKSMLTNLHHLQRLEEGVFEHENEIAKEIFKNNEERFKGL